MCNKREWFILRLSPSVCSSKHWQSLNARVCSQYDETPFSSSFSSSFFHPPGLSSSEGSPMSGLRRCAGALRGGASRDRRLGGAGRGATSLDLSLELSHLLGAGQGLEQIVLLLQLSVALD